MRTAGQVPEGFELRTAVAEDDLAIAALANEVRLVEIGVPWTTAEEIRDQLSSPRRIPRSPMRCSSGRTGSWPATSGRGDGRAVADRSPRVRPPGPVGPRAERVAPSARRGAGSGQGRDRARRRARPSAGRALREQRARRACSPRSGTPTCARSGWCGSSSTAPRQLQPSRAGSSSWRSSPGTRSACTRRSPRGSRTTGGAPSRRSRSGATSTSRVRARGSTRACGSWPRTV